MSCMPRAATSSRMRGLVSASRSAAQAYCQSSARMSSPPGWHMSSTVPRRRQAPRARSRDWPRRAGRRSRSLRNRRCAASASAATTQQKRPSAACSATRRACRRLPQHVAAHALGRITDGCDAVRRRELGDDARDSGQHVHVLVAVEMADDDAGGTHAPNLRVELAANLGQRDPAAQAACRAARQVRRETRRRPRRDSARPRHRSSGRCSVSTRCTPTASLGRLRASATACSNAGPVAMIDVDVTMPRSCASTMPRFTASAIPKSSALTMSLSAAAHLRPAKAQCFMPR